MIVRNVVLAAALALIGALLAVVGPLAGVDEPWPLLVGLGLGLVPVGGLALRALAVAIGYAVGWGISAWDVAPESLVLEFLLTGLAVLVVVLVAIVASGRLPLWAMLVGLALGTFAGPATFEEGAAVAFGLGLGLVAAAVFQLFRERYEAAYRPEGTRFAGGRGET